MTREEAIEQLKLWLNYLYPDTDIYHAVAMAIIALEEQQWTHITVRPLTDEELKEHQDWIGMYEDTPPIDEEVLVSDGKYIWTDTLMDAEAYENYLVEMWIPANIDAIYAMPTVIEREEE